ncbi:MAG: diaminopimelate decarboxylase [Planctomycetota bacterium]|nr:MAG: diaminopimelate decarboxylase [Planctomycetota bacterium]
MDHFTYQGGGLCAEDVPLDRLADRVGTPTYVYSAATLEAHYDRLASAFAPLSPLICFSLKSCANGHLARLLVERGAGLDVVSGGEIHRARLAGCPGERIAFAGVGKTADEIAYALGAPGRGALAGAEPGGPVGLFNVESEPELALLDRIAGDLGVRPRAALRINPDVDARTHRHTTTGRRENKFGVDPDRARAIFRDRAADSPARLTGLHVHIGSPVYDPASYVEALARVLRLADDLARSGDVIDTLDLGGGFGADYETGRSPTAADYARAIVPMLARRVGDGLRVVIEPGRSLAANAGVLLTRVQYVKESEHKRFVICDAGMHTLLRPALYDAFHFVWPVRVAPEHVPPRRAADPGLPGLVECDVVGPICESADYLALGRRLPPVLRGDLLAVFAAGAYGMTLASRYNSHPLPAEVLVSGDRASQIRARETLGDLVAHERAQPLPL